MRCAVLITAGLFSLAFNGEVGKKSLYWYSTVEGRSTVETQSVNPLNPHAQTEKVGLWGRVPVMRAARAGLPE